MPAVARDTPKLVALPQTLYVPLLTLTLQLLRQVDSIAFPAPVTHTDAGSPSLHERKDPVTLDPLVLEFS